MKQKHKIISLYIILIFIILFSCQKQESSKVAANDTKEKAEKLIAIGDRFYDDQNFDSAFFYYNKAKFICNPKTETERFVSTLNSMAEIQRYQGDYTGSESTLTEALPHLKHIKNPKHIWNTYIELGNNYLFTYDYNNALSYYKKALSLNTSEWRKLSTTNNIAVVLLEQSKYNEALNIFTSLIEKKEILENPESYVKVLDNIGFCYFKIKDPRALSYFKKALKAAAETKDYLSTSKIYLHLAAFYQPKNPSLSKKYAQLSYENAAHINYSEGKISALKLLINCSANSELKKYSLLYIKLNDSLTEIRQKAKNQFARIKYDSKKERNENLKLKTDKIENELQLERQKNRNIISYIIIILSLSLILALYFHLTSKAKKEKIEATYKSETRIAKKLHDELANDIYHTMAFAENKNLSVSENKEQLIKNLDVIYSRTRDISKENSPIITSEKYILFLKEMIAGFNTPDINLLLNGIENIPWNEVEKNKKITTYRVLQELLVNMKKHSNATLVGINFKKSDKNITVTYTDNGKGINLNSMTFKNGLYNVENRINSVKGEIKFDSTPSNGFKVIFKFSI